MSDNNLADVRHSESLDNLNRYSREYIADINQFLGGFNVYYAMPREMAERLRAVLIAQQQYIASAKKWGRI